ncbi:MAG: DUF1854 domain-containing protein [Pirellulales bacterium]
MDDGRPAKRVRAVRGFPITQPDYGISLVDDHGREAVWIERLDACAAPIREMVESELAMRDFLPVISRIERISSNNEPCEWDVLTDRGRTTFVLNSDEDVRRLDANRVMVTDGNKVQYLVEDIRAVDNVTRKYLERYTS